MDKEERKKEIGKQLQHLRKKAGYKSARSFADKAGLNPGTYTSYEQGERSFSYETAWEMADALEVTLDELGGREWPPGGERPLSGEERELVDDYRRMDEDDRPGFIQTARTYAYAGEAKKEGLLPTPPLAERQVREEATR